MAKTGTNSGRWSWSFATTDGPAETQTVTITADDGSGGTATTTFALSVNNVAPAVTITAPPSGSIYAVNTPVTFTGTFSDPGTLDTHTAQWTFDLINVAGTVSETNGSGSVTNVYSFGTPGVYQITLRVTDDEGGEGTANTVDDLTA